MASSGIFGFSGGPTFFAQRDQDHYANMMADPMGRLATWGGAFTEGALKSYGFGSAVRDIFTPEGNIDLSQQTADIAQGKVGEFLGQDIKIPVLGSLYGAAKAGVQALINDRTSPTMSEAQYKASPYFREAVPYDPAMTEQRAAALAMAYDRSQVRAFFGEKRPISSFFAGMAGQAVDPLNYIPIMGPAVKAAAAAKFGKVIGGALVGSSDAAINTAIAGIGTREARGKYGDDVSWHAIVTDIAVGSLIGSAFSGVLGGVEMHYDAKRAKVAAAKAARLNAPGVVSIRDRSDFTEAPDRGGDVAFDDAAFTDTTSYKGTGETTVHLPDIRDIRNGRLILNEAIGFGAHGDALKLSPNSTDKIERMAAEGAAHADRILPPTDIGRKVAAGAHAAGQPLERAAGVGQLVETVLTSFGRRTGQTADEVGALLPPLEFRGEGAAVPEGRMAAQGFNQHNFRTPSPEEFIQARNASVRPGFLSPLAPQDVGGHKLFISPDKTYGIAVDPHGDIQNVFNNGGPKGSGSKAVATAIANGGRTLDAYDGFLPDFYRQFGFVETGRMPFNPEFAPKGWDAARDGTPDVVFMTWKGYPDGNAEAAISRAASRANWITNERSTNIVTDWDAAKQQSRDEATGGAGDNRLRGQDTGQGVGGEARGADFGTGAASGRALERTFAQRGAPLIDERLTVTPTGGKKGDQIKLTDLRDALDADHEEKIGRKLFPETSKEDYAQVLDMAREELDAQKKRASSGASSGVGWYDVDTANAINLTSRVFPTLATNPTHRNVFLTFAGIFGNGPDPVTAWQAAAKAFRQFLRDGEVIPIKRDDGVKGFGGGQAGWTQRNAANEQQLGMLKKLVEREGGLEGAFAWMLKKQPRSEVNRLMSESGYQKGRYKTKAEVVGPDEYGTIAFGPKLGNYILGLNGIKGAEETATVDKWFTRMFRRWTGRMLDGPIDDDGMPGRPDPKNNEAERKTIFRIVGDLMKRYNMTAGDAQATLWFFEKRLYGAHGIRTEEGTNTAGAEKLLRTSGLDRGNDGEGGAAAGTQGAAKVGAGAGGQEVRMSGETDKVFAKRVIDKRPEPASLPENYSDYFIMDNAEIISIGDLVSSKTAEENAQGGGNAAKRMEAAAKGELSKRPPITVERRADGKYLIKDGNGTYTSVKGYGWKAMPVLVEGDAKTLFQPAYHGSGAKYDKIDPAFRGTGEGGAAFGEGFYATDIKGLGEHYRKIASRNAPVEHIYKGKKGLKVYDLSTAIADAVVKKVPQERTMMAGAHHKVEFDTLVDALRRNAFHALSDDTFTNNITKFDQEVADYERRAGVSRDEQTTWDVLKDAFREEIGKVEVKKPGALYKIDIPENHELMDWDKKLRDQPPDVLKKLQKINPRADLDETGESFYRYLARDMGWNLRGKAAEQAASDALRAAGIPGHRFLAGVDRKKGEGQHNYVIYDTDRIKILEREQPQRGSITFGSDKTIISLFKGADPSTALHESGHYFLEIFKKLADHVNAPDELRADWQAVKGWWHANAEAVAKDSGHHEVTAADVRNVLETGTSGDWVKDLAIDRGLHEQWARAFERYLREGKAPTKQLAGVFEQFKQWLIDVYKHALDLHVELSPELRGVFDRMLGGEQEAGRLAPDDFLIPPVRSFDEIYAHAQKQQTQLEDIGRQIAKDTGVEFLGSPHGEPKKRGEAEAKVPKKGYQRPTQVTDIVRGGFVMDTPDKAEAIVARLSEHFDVLDEGWGVTDAGYFDRKVIVRLEDGMVGEIQMWEPHLLDAKEGQGGHDLFKEMVKHPKGSPEQVRLENEQKALYGKAVSEAGPVWASVASAGKGSSAPKVLNRSRQASSVLSAAVDQTSAQSTSVQGAPFSSLAHDTRLTGSVTAGRPSQLENFNIRSSPTIDTTTARLDPIPAGRKEAEASLTKPDRAKEEAADLGIDLATGHADELDQIEELRTMGILSPEDEAAMKAADDDFVIAEAYGNTLKAALFCVA